MFSLNYAEACVVVDALRDEPQTLITWGWVEPKRFLAQEVCRAMNIHLLDSRYGADRVVLMAKCHELGNDDARELLQAVSRFWQRDDDGIAIRDLRNPGMMRKVRERFIYCGILPAEGETPMDISRTADRWRIKVLTTGDVLEYPIAMARADVLELVAARNAFELWRHRLTARNAE